MNRKWYLTFFAVSLVALLSLTNCASEKIATFGNLHIYVVDSTGTPVPSVEVFIASTLGDESQGIALKSGWTDANGRVDFNELGPGQYWYGVRGWKDYGALQLYTGIDFYVYLQLNKPVQVKN
jgi:hypothetical protein